MIYGESAGGESVKQLLANPPSPLPFSSAILQSEQSLLTGNGLLNYQQVLVNFNCAGVPSPIACLRRVPATDLKAYIEPNSLAFPPVDGDGTSTSDVRASISTKKWARVPAVLGTNLNEARVFLAVYGLNNGTAAIDTVFNLLGIKSPAVKQSILALYAARGITDLYLVADRYVVSTFR
jgi:carboxylesterase 2